MSSNIAIQIKNVSKHYKMYDRPQDRLKQSIFRGKKKYYKEFWALKNIDFHIEKGQTIGILGKNGSGKSTLLQIIAGTLPASSGEIEVNGRIAALLELGSGFNPEFTGRENVVMNGAILGLSNKEILEKIPMILEFSGIGQFFDQPVKSYSSGMFVRLAFACAVHVNPDILIIDEALAVGDLQFQLKCIEKMKAFKREGKTILFVSHDTYSIKNFCDQAIWVMDGQVHLRGDVNIVVNQYEDYMKRDVNDHVPMQVNREEKEQILTINKVSFIGSDRNTKKDFSFQENIMIAVDFTLRYDFEGIVGGIAIYDNQDYYICGLNTKLDEYPLPNKAGKFRLMLAYDSVKLLPGTYYIDVGFFESSGLVRLDYIKKIDHFHISSNDYVAEGVTFLDHKWNCEGQ